MAHAFVTVAVPFDDRHAGAVNAHLDALGNLKGGPIATALDRSEFVHFMSLTVVRGVSGGAAHLVLEASADGYPAGVLRRLADVIGGELRSVLDVAGVRVPDSQLDGFLVRHDRQGGQGWFSVPGVAFDGTPGVTVGRIRQEAELAAVIQRIFDEYRPRRPALAILQDVRAQLFAEGKYKWAFVAEPVPLLGEIPNVWRSIGPVASSALRAFLWPLFVLPALALVFRGLWPAIYTLGAELVLGLIAAGLAYVRFRRKEKTDIPDDGNPSAQAVAEIMARENRGMQNHLAAVSTMKPGWLRHLALRIVLWVVNVGAAYFSRPGTLSDIGTIHFARWIRLPGTDRLLFFSNYSGSWESYLEDFILRAHNGLTGVWSNTEGFPRTRNLVQDGARIGDPFKRWARRQQHPTLFWYSAYPELTTARVRINAAIRNGFASASTEADAERWLGAFRFAPPDDSTLQSDHIPILAFSGLSRLPHARSLVLRLPDAPRDARRWLAQIEPAIGYGEMMPDHSTLALGLSVSGLAKLGLDAQAIASFPTVFQHGMAEEGRARALGDVGQNAPQKWWWGGPGNEADAILTVYARSAEIRDRETGRLTEQFRPLGVTIIHEVLLDAIPPRESQTREPFGFVDGVSQPIVRGAQRWIVARNRIHVVAPGEMILGYEDNFGHLPSSPTAAGSRDLGCNGTYLVVRQLEQDVDAFTAFVADAAARLVGDPRVPRVDERQLGVWIKARMVGRWPDGTSLVRHPDQPGSVRQPGTLPDNDFLFGTEDPDGLRCPFGAHIRRVNPRETFDPGSEKQLAISNRHRIFRVGRRYGPQGQSPKPGLLFMCVNANIERQFEFVQQTYMLGSSYHGLQNEVDAFGRRHESSDVLTIPTENGPLRLRGLGDFVTMRGGGYFFMPGRDTVRFLIGEG